MISTFPNLSASQQQGNWRLVPSSHRQRTIITHLHNATAIEEQIHREQAISDSHNCHKYSNGFFLRNLSDIDCNRYFNGLLLQHMSGIDCNRYSNGLFLWHLSGFTYPLWQIVRSIVTNTLYSTDTTSRWTYIFYADGTYF